jgi:hypothetical protein
VHFSPFEGDDIDSTHTEPAPSITNVPKIIAKMALDYNKLRPFVGTLDADTIKHILMTTQYTRLPTTATLRRAFRSSNPALNAVYRNDSVACDIVYSNVPAIDDDYAAAVLYFGTDTQVIDVYDKTDQQFINTLEDIIANCGAPHKLISFCSQVIISNKVKDILHTLCIKTWRSEPYQQQQKPAERCYQLIKRAANRVLYCSGAPDYPWLLSLQYVCYLFNHAYNDTLKVIPLQLLSGVTADISPRP